MLKKYINNNILLNNIIFGAWALAAKNKFHLKKILIKNGIIDEDKRFKTIKNLQNKYTGKRCFIVATGPSLTLSDLELLKDEITISMNSIISVFDKTKYRPTFYMIQDKNVFDKINENKKIESLNPNSVYIGIVNLGKKGFKVSDVVNEKWNLFYLDLASSWQSLRCNRFNPSFSKDCYEGIIDGTTVTYSAIQLAAYMGFKEIYLIGTDCNYKGPKKHIGEYKIELYDVDKLQANLITAFSKAKEFADDNGIKIYNATRGGQLEVFPRVELDTVLRKS